MRESITDVIPLRWKTRLRSLPVLAAMQACMPASANDAWVYDPGFGIGGIVGDYFGAATTSDRHEAQRLVRLDNCDLVVAGLVPAIGQPNSNDNLYNLGLARYSANGAPVAWSNPSGAYSSADGRYLDYPNTNAAHYFAIRDLKVVANVRVRRPLSEHHERRRTHRRIPPRRSVRRQVRSDHGCAVACRRIVARRRYQARHAMSRRWPAAGRRASGRASFSTSLLPLAAFDANGVEVRRPPRARVPPRRSRRGTCHRGGGDAAPSLRSAAARASSFRCADSNHALSA